MGTETCAECSLRVPLQGVGSLSDEGETRPTLNYLTDTHLTTHTYTHGGYRGEGRGRGRWTYIPVEVLGRSGTRQGKT